jgi:hypothetical protein
VIALAKRPTRNMSRAPSGAASSKIKGRINRLMMLIVRAAAAATTMFGSGGGASILMPPRMATVPHMASVSTNQSKRKRSIRRIADLTVVILILGVGSPYRQPTRR